MRFDFDPRKSTANKAKHGIDFADAQALWNDENRLEVPARSTSEPRSQIIGRIQQTTWAAFVTYRHDTIRIIWVRRARTSEEEHYLGREGPPRQDA